MKYESGGNLSPVEDGGGSQRRPVIVALVVAALAIGGGYAWEPVSRFVEGLSATFDKPAPKPAAKPAPPQPRTADRPAPSPPATTTPPPSARPPAGTSSSSSGGSSTIDRGGDRNKPEAPPSTTDRLDPRQSPADKPAADKPAATPRKPPAAPTVASKAPDWLPTLTVVAPIAMLAIFAAIVFFVIARVRRSIAQQRGPGRGAAWGNGAASPVPPPAPAKRGFRLPPVFSLVFGAVVLDQVVTGGRYTRIAIAFVEDWIARNMP